MFPLRDSIPRVHFPFVVWALILVNAVTLGFQATMGPREQQVFLHLFGLVPRRLLDPAWAAEVGFPGLGLAAVGTHMFLHANLLHFLANMWTMWIFADNVEDVMGHGRFLLFYLLCGLAALAAHMAFNAGSPVPVIGASGAVAGVMGAYFLLYPHSKVLTLIPIFFFPWLVELPATLYLGVWFAIQLLSGFGSVASGAAHGVAWWAHAGGFLAGMVLLPLLRRNARCYHCYSGQQTTSG